MHILKQILATKKTELSQLAAGIETEARACRRRPLSLKNALETSRSGIIAEFKRKSPSKGFIHEGADAATIAAGYQRAGAAAVSVLTDSEYFGGSLDDLEAAREAVSIPILRKDFIIDPRQIAQARIAGADAVLLIAAALSPEQVETLGRYAHSLDLEVLLEIHDGTELGHVCPEADIVGINNRNLSTFVTDLRVSAELGAHLGTARLKISESGLSSPDDIRRLRRQGFSGFLVGENFMKENDPAAALENFIARI